MACRIAGPRGPGFLPMRIQESPTHDTGAEKCYSGWDSNHKSRAVVSSFWHYCESFQTTCCIKDVTFKMPSIERNK